jgi:hypothetical protein
VETKSALFAQTGRQQTLASVERSAGSFARAPDRDLPRSGAMLRRPAVCAAIVLLAAPAVARAADTPLSGLTAHSGDLAATGATIVSTGRPLARLHGTVFTPLPSAPGRILDLGTGRSGKPVLLRANCASGAALCTTPLAATTPVRRIAPIDRRHCKTTGAAIDRGRVALAVVARKGRPGQRCHAGIYSGGKRRVSVRHWRIGHPSELFRLGVTLDLRGTTALVRIAQSSFDVGDSPDTIQRLRTVSLTSGRSRTLATATAVENDRDGELLSNATIGATGVTAVGQCRQLDGPTTTEVLRWPTRGGRAKALKSPPYPDVAAAVAGAHGLVIRAAGGQAVLRDMPVFAARPAPPTLNCRLT